MSPDNPTPSDDDFEDQPGQGPGYQWGLGGLLPLILFAYGVWVVVTREATMNGRIPMSMTGLNAVAYGTAAISLAVFLHCHYFWGNLYNQAWPAVLGKIVGACGFITGAAILIVRVGVLGVW